MGGINAVVSVNVRCASGKLCKTVACRWRSTIWA
jgi:hypothetical protein